MFLTSTRRWPISSRRTGFCRSCRSPVWWQKPETSFGILRIRAFTPITLLVATKRLPIVYCLGDARPYRQRKSLRRWPSCPTARRTTSAHYVPNKPCRLSNLGHKGVKESASMRSPKMESKFSGIFAAEFGPPILYSKSSRAMWKSSPESKSRLEIETRIEQTLWVF